MSALLNAYRNTIYRIETPHGALDIRIGQATPDLPSELFSAARAPYLWHLITADNPGSRRLSPARNRPRRQRLRKLIRATGYPCWPTRAIAADGHWPDELGCWVAGPKRSAACGWGMRFGQLAIVSGDRHGIVQLVLLPQHSGASTQTPHAATGIGAPWLKIAP